MKFSTPGSFPKFFRSAALLLGGALLLVPLAAAQSETGSLAGRVSPTHDHDMVLATASIPEIKTGAPIEDVLSIGEAIERFQAEHPRPAEVVWLRFFNGLTMPEVADVMRISLATAEREWRFARAWMMQVLERDSA